MPAAEPSPSSARSPRWPWTEAAGAARAPLIWVTSPAVPGKSGQDMAWVARATELLSIPSQSPPAKSLPGALWGRTQCSPTPRANGDGSCVKERRSPPSLSLALGFGSAIAAC